MIAEPSGDKSCERWFLTQHRSYRTSIHPYDFCMSRRVHYIIISERKLVLKGGILVDLSAIGSRIKVARERKHFTQEDLAAIVDLSPTHISVIERGVKPPKLATLVAIANALDVSADTLLQDVVERSEEGVFNELAADIMKLPVKERSKIINAIRALTE